MKFERTGDWQPAKQGEWFEHDQDGPTRATYDHTAKSWILREVPEPTYTPPVFHATYGFAAQERPPCNGSFNVICPVCQSITVRPLSDECPVCAARHERDALKKQIAALQDIHPMRCSDRHVGISWGDMSMECPMCSLREDDNQVRKERDALKAEAEQLKAENKSITRVVDDFSRKLEAADKHTEEWHTMAMKTAREARAAEARVKELELERDDARCGAKKLNKENKQLKNQEAYVTLQKERDLLKEQLKKAKEEIVEQFQETEYSRFSADKELREDVERLKKIIDQSDKMTIHWNEVATKMAEEACAAEEMVKGLDVAAEQLKVENRELLHANKLLKARLERVREVTGP